MLLRDVKELVQPVEGGLEIEIVPETMPEDKGVGSVGLFRWEECAETVELVGWDGEADHHLNLNKTSAVSRNEWKRVQEKLTDDVDCTGWTC